MNASMLPIYGATYLTKSLRRLANYLNQGAGHIEARRALTEMQKTVLKRNASFSDIHQGQPAFVIVNGPSLATQNIHCLKDQLTFVVSGFWKHEAVSSWQPSYYSLLDPAFFSDTPAILNFYRNMQQQVQKSTFFVPLFRGFDAVKKHALLPEDRTYYVASVGPAVSGNDLTGIVQGFESVSAFALAQAVYMGCSPIYLLGFDHDFLANRGVAQHFYHGGTVVGHPSTNMPVAARNKYDEDMLSCIRLWQNYRELSKVAASKKIEIINTTRGGYLDVFPREEYEKVIEKLGIKI